MLSLEDKKLEESSSAIHLKLNDAPFITADYKMCIKINLN